MIAFMGLTAFLPWPFPTISDFRRGLQGRPRHPVLKSLTLKQEMTVRVALKTVILRCSRARNGGNMLKRPEERGEAGAPLALPMAGPQGNPPVPGTSRADRVATHLLAALAAGLVVAA